MASGMYLLNRAVKQLSKCSPLFTNTEVNEKIIIIVNYRKILVISPGPIQLCKGFLVSFFRQFSMAFLNICQEL